MRLFSKKPAPESARTISLWKGEVSKKSFDVKKSNEGKGIYHITNYRVIFETLKKGVVFDIDWNHLKSAHAKKKDVVMLVWETDAGTKERFELKFGNPANQVVAEMETANKDWSRNHSMTEEQARNECYRSLGITADTARIPDDEAERIRKMRGEKYEAEYYEIEEGLEARVGPLEKRLAEMVQPERYDPKSDHGKLEMAICRIKKEKWVAAGNVNANRTMKMVRDPRIPPNIPNEHVWNDCYYDKDWDGYVTFNERFIEYAKPRRGPETTKLNEKFQKEVGNGGSISFADCVKIVFGFPSIAGTGTGEGHDYLMSTIEPLFDAEDLKNFQTHADLWNIGFDRDLMVGPPTGRDLEKEGVDKEYWLATGRNMYRDILEKATPEERKKFEDDWISIGWPGETADSEPVPAK